MKKSLLALAVLGAFAGAASAQTSVTIYGVIDASVQYKDVGGTTGGETWSQSSGQMSGSRLGFRGTEDLGGGLSGIFTLENGFNVDTGEQGQSRLFGRQAWVGLQGGFGSVRVGRIQTVAYGASVAVDPFGAANSHGSQRMFASGAYNSDPFLRANNTLSYSTANYSGFTGTAAYSFGEKQDAFSANRTTQLGVSYVNGPINAQLSHLRTNASTDAIAFRAATLTSLQVDAKAASSTDVTSTLIGGSYDFGVVKPFAAYVDSKAEATVSSVTTTTKVRNYLLGVSAPVGAAGTVLASWIRNDKRDVADGEEDQFSLGYVHKLSARTNAYTALSLNKAGKNGGVNAPNDEDAKLLSVGVRHSF